MQPYHGFGVPDYGRPLEFGYFLIPDAADVAATLGWATSAEEAGLDLIGIQDHPYQRRFLDTWTLLTAVAMQTRRVRVFPDVANLPLRAPALLAKSAASLDLLSGGRFELGLGAGGFWDAIAAMGGPRRSPGESVEALEEAIQVIRLLWSEQPAVRFAGRHYQLNGVRPGPPPAHPIGIWLGAYKPRMLRLVGRLADGWVPSLGYLGLDEIAAMHATIDAAAEAAGRDPASLRRILNVGDDVTQDQLFTLASVHGFDSFILSTGSRDTLERFGKEMAPALRALIKRERAS